MTTNTNYQAVRDNTEVSAGGISITGPAINHAQLCMLISGLELEVRTGFKMYAGISLLKKAEELFGVKARNKKAALEGLLFIYQHTYGRPYGQEVK